MTTKSAHLHSYIPYKVINHPIYEKEIYTFPTGKAHYNISKRTFHILKVIKTLKILREETLNHLREQTWLNDDFDADLLTIQVDLLRPNETDDQRLNILDSKLYHYIGFHMYNDVPATEYQILKQKIMLMYQRDNILKIQNSRIDRYYTIISKIFNGSILQYFSQESKIRNDFISSLDYRTMVSPDNYKLEDTPYVMLLTRSQALKVIRYCLDELKLWHRYYGTYADPREVEAEEDPYMVQIFNHLNKDGIRIYGDTKELTVGIIKANHNDSITRKMNKIYLQRISRWGKRFPTIVYQHKKIVDSKGNAFVLMLRKDYAI